MFFFSQLIVMELRHLAYPDINPDQSSVLMPKSSQPNRKAMRSNQSEAE